MLLFNSLIVFIKTLSSIFMLFADKLSSLHSVYGYNAMWFNNNNQTTQNEGWGAKDKQK